MEGIFLMWKTNLANERIGTIGENNFGSPMVVVEYKNKDDILVQFLEHNNKVHTRWRDFEYGKVKNPYDKTVYGVGYLGEGRYKSYMNGKETPQYSTWNRMMQRCYSKKLHERLHTYRGCSVDVNSYIHYILLQRTIQPHREYPTYT
jgi:hypothetical protein